MVPKKVPDTFNSPYRPCKLKLQSNLVEMVAHLDRNVRRGTIMDNRAGIVIGLALLNTLCLCGCKVRVDELVESEEQSPPVAHAGNVETSDKINVVTMLPFPVKKGLRPYYRAVGMTFNMRGGKLLASLEVKKWVEFRIGEDRRALVILDQVSNTSLVIIYEDFKEGSRSLSLWEGRNAAKAWALRHSAMEGKEDMIYKWRGFLTEPAASEIAFELKGDIKLTRGEGLVSEIVCEELKTKYPVPPDNPLLLKQREWVERNLAHAKARLLENPRSKINELGVKQEKMRLKTIDDLLGSPVGFPAGYVELRIAAEWAREKPLFEIELL